MARPGSGQDVVVALRPEVIRLVDKAAERAVPGTVETVLSAGPTQLIQVLIRQGDTTIRVTGQEGHEKRVSPGQQVFVEISPRDTLFFDAESGMSLTIHAPDTGVAS